MYIGHLQLFLLFRHLSSDERNNEDHSDATTPAHCGALVIAIKAEQGKGAGDYCNPGRPGTAADQTRTQGEGGLGEALVAKTGHPRALRHTDAGADVRVAWGLQNLPQNRAIHVRGNDRQTDSHNLQEPGLSVRLATGPKLAVIITLSFLATVDSYRSLAFSFRVSHSTISLLVSEVCRDIVDEYTNEVLAMPTTPDG